MALETLAREMVAVTNIVAATLEKNQTELVKARGCFLTKETAGIMVERSR